MIFIAGRTAAKADESTAAESNFEARWDGDAGPQLSAVLEGSLQIPNDIVPFDAGSDVPIDEQK